MVLISVSFFLVYAIASVLIAASNNFHILAVELVYEQNTFVIRH